MRADFTLQQAINFAISEGYSRYPVYTTSLDEIIGVIYTKDLMRTMMAVKKPDTLEPLIRKTYFIPESKKIKDVLKEFQKKRMQMAIVTNEIGEVSGIVSMEDILEELVGEIQDEYDNEKPYVEKIGTNTFLVSAHRKLSDINKYLPYRLDESEEYETLSGLIAFMYPQELQEGDIVNVDPYLVRIKKMYRNSAETVELEIVSKDDDDM